MSRLPGWRGRLMGYVARERARPFAYGSADCALFAAGAVAAVTGRDIAAGWRGRYTTEAEGRRALGVEGFIDHIDLARCLFARVAASQAQTGDLAVVATRRGPALGVVSGSQVLVRTERGLGAVDLAAADYALRV